jgi:stage II sporulation protein D
MAILAFFLICVADLGAASRNRHSSEPILRVKIGNTFTELKIAFPEGGWLELKGRRIRTLRKKEVFSWTTAVTDKKKRKKKPQYAGQIILFRSSASLVELNGKSYRGNLQIDFSGNGAKAVNLVGIEDYLRGVVGSEIGSRSPSESLKAQTVIARTYAYASRNKHGSEGADVCDSTHCQVYSGVSAERETIDAAVKGTRGIIMISDGEPIATLYHASCGGMTSDNEKVFGGAPRSYLRRVVCPFCRNGTNYRWSRSIDIRDLRTALAKEKIRIADVYDIEVESAGHMDRVDNMVLHTGSGIVKVKGTTIRRIFNLPSTTFACGSRKTPVKAIAMARQDDPPRSELQLKKPERIMIAALTILLPPSRDSCSFKPPPDLSGQPGPKPAGQSIGTARPSLRPASTGQKASYAALEPPLLQNTPLDKLEIFGRGYGHQVGLCQAGAIELGKRNWSYRQILAFYYSNVALRSLDY